MGKRQSTLSFIFAARGAHQLRTDLLPKQIGRLVQLSFSLRDWRGANYLQGDDTVIAREYIWMLATSSLPP